MSIMRKENTKEGKIILYKNNALPVLTYGDEP
jgi:hypothetical protein